MLRIAVTGPESSGKTTLCKALSEYFKVAFVPEYARAYLKENERSIQAIRFRLYGERAA